MTARTPVETLQAAIDKLREAEQDVVATEKISPDVMRLALRLIVPVHKILRHDVALYKGASEDDIVRLDAAVNRSGDAELCDAILGGTE